MTLGGQYGATTSEQGHEAPGIEVPPNAPRTDFTLTYLHTWTRAKRYRSTIAWTSLIATFTVEVVVIAS